MAQDLPDRPFGGQNLAGRRQFVKFITRSISRLCALSRGF
jgi:hypothetical protein